MNALVDVWHRDARARNRYRAGRLYVSSCNGLPKMWYPVAYMGDAPKLRRSPYPPHNIRHRRPLRLAWGHVSIARLTQGTTVSRFSGGATLCRKTMEKWV